MPKTLSFAEDDPFPGIANGAEIPGTRIQSSPGVTQTEWESTPTYQNWSCPSNSGRAMGVDLNFTTARSDDVWFNYCVKQWQPKETVDAWAKYRSDLAAAQAAAETESKAWNAANPGKQKCVQWGPITDPNGGTSSGGVCANPVDPGPNTTVPTQSAPSVEAPTTSTSSSSSTTPSASGNTSSSSETTSSTSSTSSGSTNTTSTTTSASTAPTEDFSKWGSGTPFTRVLKGQLSTSECPSGFQAANGIIVAIGSGTFTECWPENAWSAYRLGGSVWDQFKSSGGNYDAKAELDRRNKVSELKSLAKSVAQAAADQTPGIQRCSKWTGYGESGEECAYTFVKPSSDSTSTSGSTTSNSSSSETTTVTSNSSTSSSSSSGASSAASSADPYPNLNNGDEIPNTRFTSTAGLTQSQWEQTSLYKGHTCPSGSGKATGVDLNFTVSQSDDKWFVYCVKSILSTTIPISDSATVSTSEGSKTNSNSGNSETSTATTSTSNQNSSSSNTPSTINTDSSTATTNSSSTTSPSTGSSGTTSTTQTSTPTLQSRAIEVNGTVSELKSLVGKVVENQKEAKSISTLINRLDSVVSKTSVKQIKLPGSSQVEEIAESKTPEICSVLGVTVNSLKKGTCIISYTVVDSDGNKFTTQKEIYFRK